MAPGRSLLLSAVAWSVMGAVAQHRPPQNSLPQTATSLQATIAAQDAALFAAVNTCDIPRVATFWAEDADFLHDQASPTFGGKAITQSIQANLCGKVRRELVPGSMEVYPLKDYGAVEIGVHRFLHPGLEDHDVIGEAKFVHVWRHTDAGWKITHVVSYEHHAVE